jgi:RNA polymerase sigma factor (sigma-70 family)
MADVPESQDLPPKSFRGASEKDLAAGLAAAERQVRDGAWAEFLMHWAPDLLKYIYHKRSEWASSDDANDILGDAVVRIGRSIRRFEYLGPGSFRAWCRLIADRAVATWFRARHNSAALTFVSFDDVQDEYLTHPDPEDGEDEVRTPAQDERQAAVHQAIGQLSVREQQVLVMMYFRGQNDIEIAQELGLSRGNVRTIASRARARTRALLPGWE